MIRWFWRIYVPLAAAVLLFLVTSPFGPAIETRFWPVRGAQFVQVVERTDARLCWTWTFDKLRPLASDNIDVFIGTPAVPSASTTVFNRATGMPWGITAQAVSLGVHTMTWCVLLPPYVGPHDSVTVRQTASYPGWAGLWRLPVEFPDVVSLPEGRPL